MDYFLNDIDYLIFVKYVYYHLPNSKLKKTKFGITITNDEYHCSLFFSEEHVIEMTREDPIYYLHFEFLDFLKACRLFHDFLEFLMPKVALKVLICCSSALTSSYLKEELQQYINDERENMIIGASSFNRIEEVGHDYDLILLAPQIGYQLMNIDKSLNVRVIPTNLYATYNLRKIVEFIHNER